VGMDASHTDEFTKENCCQNLSRFAQKSLKWIKDMPF
jgi:hypothetical protein